MNNIITRIIDLPNGVRGFVMPDDNDDYNIYINARLTADEQKEVYQHELNHINMDHFHSDKDIEQIEKEAKQ